MNKIKNYLRELNAKIEMQPLDLKYLFWFSVVVVFLYLYLIIFASNNLYEKTIPYLGWSPQFIYLIIVSIILFQTPLQNEESNSGNFKTIRYKVIALFVFYLIINFLDWYSKSPEYGSHSNPYLRYSVLRPIYTILIPLFWILIIGWPLLLHFYSNKYKSAK